MNLNRVATFVEVVERGSFTAAARSLGLPVSSVSRAVARLEEEVGSRLLQRTTRRLAPTDAGRAFFERARGALQGLNDAQEAATEAGSAVRGTIRITAPPDSGPMFAAIFAAFLLEHPQVKLDLLLTQRAVDLVEEGVDLALRAGPRLKDSTLVARKVAATPVRLYASPAYLAARGTPRRLADLAHHDVVLVRRGTGMHGRWHLDGPRGMESVEVGGRIAMDDMGFAVHAAIAGVGIVAAPSLLCAEAVREGRLTQVLSRHGIGAAALWLVYPAARQLPLRVALLRDHLAAEVQRVAAHPSGAWLAGLSGPRTSRSRRPSTPSPS